MKLEKQQVQEMNEGMYNDVKREKNRSVRIKYEHYEQIFHLI